MNARSVSRQIVRSVPRILAYSATMDFIWNKMEWLCNAHLVGNSTVGYARLMDFARNAFLVFTKQMMTLVNLAPPKIVRPATPRPV